MSGMTPNQQKWFDERTRKRFVLMVEDELELRKVFAQFAKEFHCDFIEASDGEEGIQLFHKINPDIVFLDLRLPKVDGVEVFRHIKAAKHDQPVVVMSGYLDDDVKKTLNSIGYAAKIDKTTELNIAYIANILETFGIPRKKPKNGDSEHHT